MVNVNTNKNNPIANSRRKTDSPASKGKGKGTASSHGPPEAKRNTPPPPSRNTRRSDPKGPLNDGNKPPPPGASGEKKQARRQDQQKGFGLNGRMFPGCRLPQEKDLPDPKALRDLMSLLEPDAGSDAFKKLENASIPAGYTFLGQFIAHDLTFDPTSIEESVRDLRAVENFRTPALDLDSIYGSGPQAMPWLYDPEHYGSFLLHRDDDPYDVARNRKGVALMADPRNDGNLVLSQLHVALLKLHNRILGRLDEKKYLPPEERFHKARRLVILLYQHVVWHDYLRKICVEKVLDYFQANGKPLFYLYGEQSEFHEPYLPVEFNHAFRFGHAQVKPRYRLNPGFEAEFGAEQIQENLRGRGRPLTANQRIDWSYFFRDERVQDQDRPQASRRIGPEISSQAGDLPREALPPAGRDVTSLSERDLRRAANWRVPSGNDVSYAIYKALTGGNGRNGLAEIVDLLKDERQKFPTDEIWPATEEAAGAVQRKEAPLLYYVLREAAQTKEGERLGVYGSWIIAEVIHGMLKFSKDEGNGRYGVSQSPKFFLEDGTTWNPTLEPCLAGLLGNTTRLEMIDLLRLVDTRKPIQLVTYPTTP